MSLQVKDKIAAKEGKSRIPGRPKGIRENLSIEAYIACDRSRHDQGSFVCGKAGYISSGLVWDCAAKVWLSTYRHT